MDEFSSYQASPKVEFNQDPFFQTLLGRLVILGLIILFLALGVFVFSRYLNKNILNPALLPSSNRTVGIKPVTSPPPTPLPADQLNLSCPVPKEFCSQGKIIKDGDQILGIGYSLPLDTPVLSVIDGQARVTGTADPANGITNHSKIILGGVGSYQGYTATYEYFGLPEIKLGQLNKVTKNQEMAALLGGFFPKENPYQGVNLLLKIETNDGKILDLQSSRLITP